MRICLLVVGIKNLLDPVCCLLDCFGFLYKVGGFNSSIMFFEGTFSMIPDADLLFEVYDYCLDLQGCHDQ
jgi:hypothetical protein